MSTKHPSGTEPYITAKLLAVIMRRDLLRTDDPPDSVTVWPHFDDDPYYFRCQHLGPEGEDWGCTEAVLENDVYRFMGFDREGDDLVIPLSRLEGLTMTDAELLTIIKWHPVEGRDETLNRLASDVAQRERVAAMFR